MRVAHAMHGAYSSRPTVLWPLRRRDCRRFCWTLAPWLRFWC